MRAIDAMRGVIAALTTVTTAQTAATTAATAAQTGLNTAMAANPIGMVVAAVAALVAGLVAFIGTSAAMSESLDTLENQMAYYDSSDDTISVVFANEPMRLLTYSNNSGFYNETLGSDTYGELQGNEVRIVNDEGVYTVLRTEGVQSDTTLRVTANRIHLVTGCELSKYALVLGSSTENSTKKFRITVDDSGTITATEVS